MARPVRVDVEGGWYHVTARGTERRAIFVDERDHEHFASVYIHLNPIRTKNEGLGKQANRAEAQGLAPIDREVVQRRLKKLRGYRWNSYGAYAGYASAPDWLSTAALLKRAGGSKAYREHVQQHVRRGDSPEGYEECGGRVALGSQAFLAKV